jgi:quercetin dioxygenase-like cupin family protein
MKHLHYDEVEARPATEAGAERVRVRWLIAPEDGAPNFYMRRFEVAPGGTTPRHSHAWEHEVYVLEGEGSVFCDGARERFRAGDFVYVPPGAEHCFAADAGVDAAFLCIIPKSGRPS